MPVAVAGKNICCSTAKNGFAHRNGASEEVQNSSDEEYTNEKFFGIPKSCYSPVQTKG
jgi:hypothetical protein